MKIVFITFYDSSNPKEWSGIPTKMIEYLKKNKIEVISLRNYHPDILTKIILRIKKYYFKMIHKNYLFDRNIKYIKHLSKKVNKDLIKIENYDLILSPGTLPISFIQSNKPIYIWTDATFLGMLDYYPEFSNLSKESIRNGIWLENMAFEKANKVIFSSDWALNTAIKLHGLPKEKGAVIKFGANFENNFNKENTLMEIRKKRFNNTLNFLFVGVDWKRKGGEIAEEIVKTLNEEGINSKLEVVGISSLKNKNYLTSHGFLNIDNLNHRLLLEDLFFTSHFFILPTTAECFGIVFCEASSFGLPIISYETGGVSSAVVTNQNGFLFKIGTNNRKIVNMIKSIYLDKSLYFNLCIKTYEQYQKNLNWNVAIKSLIKLF